MEVEADDMCFGCGKANDFGLKLDFEFEGEGLVARFRPTTRHQGYAGFVHGGILATLADEAMAKYLFLRDIPALTASMELRYKNPVRVGKPVSVRAEIAGRKGRLIEMSAVIAYDGCTHDEREKRALVEARAKFIEVEMNGGGERNCTAVRK